MKIYDPSKPLIVIHIPKSGGTSFKNIIKKWYGRRFLTHYINIKNGRLPRKHRLKRWFSDKYRQNICIYGHFNKNRGFGIEEYYPEIEQFVTILRDPFDLMVSEYFYLKKVQKDIGDKSWVPDSDLADFLMSRPPNMLNHFPFTLTEKNYKELLDKYFIYIGVTEDMNVSVKKIAEKLGFEYEIDVPVLNTTKKVERVPLEIKEEFMKKNKMEYFVYQYALDNYQL